MSSQTMHTKAPPGSPRPHALPGRPAKDGRQSPFAACRTMPGISGRERLDLSHRHDAG
ncbi:hypothetical protein SAMN05443665_103158 [Actinomadura meyerae]|jgi:hypothetical protein|uniref:Uncharacterized protein n=1 Tax=Actinomadura meyerae TaxID=240840 RepID=A0A239MS04_9ACTN|nr:hypothetical protein [Actinomadura meyerae]SNT45526.1 hypothetical protein SAMN05443665_103158 [Actinomadura meyerae]